MDKAIFKNLLSYLGLPVIPTWVVVEEDYKNQGPKLIRKINSVFTYPFVKPANMGSSVGISKQQKEPPPLGGSRTAVMIGKSWWKRL